MLVGVALQLARVLRLLVLLTTAQLERVVRSRLPLHTSYRCTQIVQMLSEPELLLIPRRTKIRLNRRTPHFSCAQQLRPSEAKAGRRGGGWWKDVAAVM